MSSRNRGGGVSVGHDSFLDIVANLVGVLIILVVVLGAQSQAVLRQAEQQAEVEIETPVEPEVVDPLDRPAGDDELGELAAIATQAAAAQHDSNRLEKTIQHLDAKVARQSERRTILLTLLEEAEAAWEQKQTELSEAKQTAVESIAEASRLRDELSELTEQLQDTQDRKEPVIAIQHLPTPMAKTVFGTQVMFRLKNKRLSVVPKDALVKEVITSYMRSYRNSSAGVIDSAAGPIRDYVARYSVDNRATTNREMVMFVYPLEEPYGIPVEQALANRDWLDIELVGHNPRTTTIVVAVYPDSFDAYRDLKKALYERGYATGGHPVRADDPIRVSLSNGGHRVPVQ